MKITAALVLLGLLCATANAAAVPPSPTSDAPGTAPADDVCALVRCADGYSCRGIQIRGKARAFCVPASDSQCACAPSNIRLCADGKHVAATICRTQAASSDAATTCAEAQVQCPRECDAEVDCAQQEKPTAEGLTCPLPGSKVKDSTCSWSARDGMCAWTKPKCVVKAKTGAVLSALVPVLAENGVTLPAAATATAATALPTGATGVAAAEDEQEFEFELPEGMEDPFATPSADAQSTEGAGVASATEDSEQPLTLPAAAPAQETGAMEVGDIVGSVLGKDAPTWAKEIAKGVIASDASSATTQAEGFEATPVATSDVVEVPAPSTETSEVVEPAGTQEPAPEVEDPAVTSTDAAVEAPAATSSDAAEAPAATSTDAFEMPAATSSEGEETEAPAATSTEAVIPAETTESLVGKEVIGEGEEFGEEPLATAEQPTSTEAVPEQTGDAASFDVDATSTASAAPEEATTDVSAADQEAADEQLLLSDVFELPPLTTSAFDDSLPTATSAFDDGSVASALATPSPLGVCSVAPCNFKFCGDGTTVWPMVCAEPKSAAEQCFAQHATCTRIEQRGNKCGFVLDRRVFAQCIAVMKGGASEATSTSVAMESATQTA